MGGRKGRSMKRRLNRVRRTSIIYLEYGRRVQMMLRRVFTLLVHLVSKFLLVSVAEIS